MSGLRIVGDTDLPSGVENFFPDFPQLSQEEESCSSTEVTWGE
jgi:hypothetical protein